MKTNLEPNDLRDVLGMAGAVNSLAVVNWLADRIQVIADDYLSGADNDELVERIDTLRLVARAAFNRQNGTLHMTEDKEYRTALAILWRACWSSKRWSQYSHPVLMLAVQVLANIAAYDEVDYGLADFNLYANAVDEIRGWIAEMEVQNV